MKLSNFTIKTTKLLKVALCNRQKSSLTMSTNEMKTVRDFGYGFTAAGKLHKIDSKTGEPGDEPFDFNISKDHSKNQRHYEELGDAITEHVYELLEKNGMHKIYVPENLPKDQATFVFANKKDLSGSKKLLVLIHGGGVVRAGQWARSLIINHSLDHGTQIPYIKKALAQGYDILIANTNDNYRNVDGSERAIPGHGSPMEHGTSVWKKFVINESLMAVGVVAHSYGGVVTLDLARKFSEFFKSKVFAVGFTDSVHSISGVPEDIRGHLQNIGRNWVTSTKKLDERLSSSGTDIPRYSAGHTKHEWTSYSCMDALFEFFDAKHDEFLNQRKTKKPKTDL